MAMTNEIYTNDSGITYKQVGLLILFFILGFIASLFFANVKEGVSSVFSPTELIGFVLSVLLSGASIVLAIVAISLGKSSEQAVIRRSDESIKLQNEIFVRTNDALQRIEASTGVTEKRIEDIISGRVGDISQRVAELTTQGTVNFGKNTKELEQKIRDSIMQSMKEQDFRSGVEKRREEWKNRMEVEEKKRKEYQKFHQAILNGFSNRNDLKVIKSSHGSVSNKGDDLFDGVYKGKDIRIGVSTFSEDFNPDLINVFVAKAASEIAAGVFSHIYLVLITPYDQKLLAEEFEKSAKHLKPEISRKILMVKIHPDNADEEIEKIKFPA